MTNLLCWRRTWNWGSAVGLGGANLSFWSLCLLKKTLLKLRFFLCVGDLVLPLGLAVLVFVACTLKLCTCLSWMAWEALRVAYLACFSFNEALFLPSRLPLPVSSDCDMGLL